MSQHNCHPRALAVAWTLNDLAGGAVPGADEVGAALDFRDRGVA
ncbi:hypothetical protein [Rhodococcus sp. 06-1477-1A]|nr:hypothetical protein [Rhodococcus sp. 06-1477-1A]